MGSTRIRDDAGYRPFIEGTRITVQHVVEYHKIFGWNPAQIAEAFRLTLAQVHAALTYYDEHQAQIDTSLAADRAADKDLHLLKC